MITVARNDLLAALAVTRGVRARWSRTAQLCFDGESLAITATSGNANVRSIAFSRSTAPATGDAFEPVGVDVIAFHRIVTSMPGNAIALTPRTGLVVDADDIRFTLPCCHDWPTFPEGAPSSWHTIPAEAIRQVAAAVSTDDARYGLNGMFVEATRTGTRLVATDGHRLSYVDIEGIGLRLPEKTLLPRPTVARMVQHGGALGVHGDWVFIRGDGYELADRLIDGEFPDYRARGILDNETDHVWLVRTAPLQAALRRAMLVWRGSPMVCRAEAGRLTLSAKNIDVGEWSESLPIETPAVGAGPARIGLSPRYLLDLTARCGERVEIRFGHGLGPVHVHDPARSDARHIIMPMRLDDVDYAADRGARKAS